MTPKEAFTVAEMHIEPGFAVERDTLRETAFGFYFHVTTKDYLRTGDLVDLPVGSCGVLVDRLTGDVHDLGSAFGLEYWLEAYDRGLHLPMDVVVLSVSDRQRAASALMRLQMSYIIPEVAYGETWTIPKHYNQKDFIRSFDSLPARFGAQRLIFRMHDLDAIDENPDVNIELELHKGG
ncbi:hypothetical protein [Novipirellula caenicola]